MQETWLLITDAVSHNGVDYTAKWWTKGEVPGSSLAWARRVASPASSTSAIHMRVAGLNFSAYPNPAQAKINIKCDEVMSFVQLINEAGLVVLSEQINSTEHFLDVSSLAPSVYNLRVTSDTVVMNKKVVLHR